MLKYPLPLSEKFFIPDTSKIPMIPISTFRNHRPPIETEENSTLKAKLMQAGSELPSFFIQFDNIPSLFITTTVLIDTTKLEDLYRPFLGLYLDALFEVSWHYFKLLKSSWTSTTLGTDITGEWRTAITWASCGTAQCRYSFFNKQARQWRPFVYCWDLCSGSLAPV